MAWSDDMHLASMVEYGVRVLAWQQTKDGHKNRRPPKPLTPPVPRAEIEAKKAREQAKARRAIASMRTRS